MNLDKILIDKIRLAAGNNRTDNVSYCVAEVVAQEDGTSYNSDDNTVICKLLSSKATNYDNWDEDNNEGYFSDSSINVNSVNDRRHFGNTYYNNVQLMCGVDDGHLVVPSIGSRVVLLTSTYQNPLIIQYSGIEQIVNSYNNYTAHIGSTTQSTIVTYNSGTMSINTTNTGYTNNLTMLSDTTSVNIVNGTKNSNISINPSISKIEVINGSNTAHLSIQENIATLKSSLAELTLTDLVHIQSNYGINLHTVIDSMLSVMQQIADTAIPSGGGVISGLDPSITTNISNLQQDNNNLLV